MKKLTLILTIGIFTNFLFAQKEESIEKFKEKRTFYAKDGSKKEITVTFNAVYDPQKDDIVEFYLNPEDYKNLGISKEEFDKMLKEGINEKNVAKSATGSGDCPKETSPFTCCIEYCNQKYTDENGNKIRGRGRCKTNCWIDVGIRLVERLLEKLVD